MGELAQAYGCPCDCLVTGFEPLIDILCLPDPNDRHVVAAAIKGRADVIVTFNLKHLPAETLNAYDIDVQHPVHSTFDRSASCCGRNHCQNSSQAA